MILLVSPRMDGMKTPQARLGIGYIASHLKKEGIPCDIMNMSYETRDDDEFIQYVIDRGYKTVGFSLKAISQLLFVEEVGVKLKEKGITLIAGGYLPTLSGEFILNNYPSIDYIIRGEAEESMRYFLTNLDSPDLLKCPGLAYQKDGEIITNKIPELSDNLDELPYPERPYLEVQLKNNLSMNMVSSRGCVNECSFCAISTFYRMCTSGRFWRSQSPEALYEEMECYHKKYGVSHFNFVDNNFFGSFSETKERALEFADILIEKNAGFKYRTSLRSDNIDEKMIERMSQSGLAQVFIGIESLVPRQLEFYNKKISPEQSHNAIKILKKYGVDFQIGLLWFDRETTLEELNTNLEFTKTIDPNNIHHFPNAILRFTHQTALQKKVQKEKYIEYDQRNNAYNYEIEDETVRRIHEICNIWVKKYYELYQLLIRLRFDYWSMDTEFCQASKDLYHTLKQAELDFFTDVVRNGTDSYEEKIESQLPLFKELLQKGFVLYERVIDKKGPLYKNFNIR